MARPLDRGYEHSLVPGASSRDTLGNDSTLLRYEALKFLVGFVVNKIFLVVAKAARTFLSDLS
jgi:hypothetical protein